MKKIIILILAVLLVAGLIKFKYNTSPYISQDSVEPNLHDSDKFSITSSVFSNQGKIPSEYTCDGSNISPPLTIKNVPQDAKSLVLIVDDMDTPQGVWVHWLVYNIPPDIQNILENSMPIGSQVGKNSFGNKEYAGPCPLYGEHRYIFKLYAIDHYIVLPESPDRQEIINEINGHVLAESVTTGIYTRN